MDKLKKQIQILIDRGSKFEWENYSNRDVIKDTFGGEPATQWNIWANRIEKILQKTVKNNSEPFIYYKEASKTQIAGNYIDAFDFAKNNYLKALSTLLSLINEGDIFEDLIIDNNTIIQSNSVNKPKSKISSSNSKNVFIVHGHDHALKIELEVFLSHIGLKPIVLHRETDGGQTIIEKFESNSDVAYAFILLTPDEVSYTKDQENIIENDRKIETRARPNVIFEFGYFVAKLGRQRVCVLHKGDVAIPSDLSGFIYKQVDKKIDEIGFSLIKELKSAGLKPKL